MSFTIDPSATRYPSLLTCIRIDVLVHIAQGHVSFDSNGTRHQTMINILQYRYKNTSGMIEHLVIGQIDTLNNNILEYVNNHVNDTVFPGIYNAVQ